jgi:hypothetical protein
MHNAVTIKMGESNTKSRSAKILSIIFSV